MSAIGGYSNYVQNLVQSKSEGRYICRNKKTDERAVFNIKKGFYIQPLRELIQDGLRYKDELLQHPNDARTVIDILRAKCDKAKARLVSQKQNAFVNLIKRICDRVRNFFLGLGFKTTLGLGNALIVELEKKASPQKSAPPPPVTRGTPPPPSDPPPPPLPVTGGTPPPPSDPPPPPPPVKSGTTTLPTTTSATTSSLATTSSTSPSPRTDTTTPQLSSSVLLSKRILYSFGRGRIEAYKKDPEHYAQKAEIFKKIKTIMPEPRGELNMVDFIKEITKKDIDLKDPLAMQIVLDTFSYGSSDNRDKSLVDFLAKEKTFHSGLLIKCLNLFNQEHQAGYIINDGVVRELLNVYIKKKWNKSLSVNDPTIASAMEVLLIEEKAKKDMLSWMMSDSAFSFQTFIRYISVYQYLRYKPCYKNVEVASPCLDILINYYKAKPEWEKSFDVDNADLHKALAFTLQYCKEITELKNIKAETLVKDIETFVKEKAASVAV